MRSRVLAVMLLLVSACAAPPDPPPAPVAVTRALGTWTGRGSQTIGIVSESGRLRIAWRTTDARDPSARGGEAGSFRLALHSAVSGRPIELITDHRGAGEGVVDVADDPRPYNFLVDARGVEWTFSVEEIVAGQAPAHDR